jgi:serine/threonine protein phosphatase PrpC
MIKDPRDAEDADDPFTGDADDQASARRATLSPLLGTDETPLASSTVRVNIAARSHHGARRQRNEDHYLVMRVGRDQQTLATSLSGGDVPADFAESAYAMFVADGLGEGGSGSVASRVALSTIAHLALQQGQWNVRIDAATAEHIMERAEWFFAKADAAVHTHASSSPVLTGMTTALTAAYSAGTDLFIAHVGHSRAYLFRDGELTMLTRDHTIARHLADTNRPAAVERRAQDLSHILTDAIGAPGAHPLVEVERFQLQDHDCVLLCTNGLTDMIDDDRIAEVLALRRQPGQQCDTLLEMANRAGGGDNVTVVLAEYHVPAT